MILILGGTTEASRLAALLAATHHHAMISLAGRTAKPAALPLPTRIGGFGGVEGLTAFIERDGVTALIDATHPFAERISANAARASALTGTPLLVLRRKPWTRKPGDEWTEVTDAGAAATALGEAPRRVFLTTGRLELPAFLAAPQHHYVIRTVDAPDALPLRHRLILDRGPFAAEDEERIMRSQGLDCLVTKNSGGSATYGKIVAARRLGLSVIMIRAPERPDDAVETAEEALAWIEARSADPSHQADHPRGE